MGKSGIVVENIKKLFFALLVALVLITIGFFIIRWIGDDTIVEEMSEVFIEDYTGMDLDLSSTKE